jgi:hypothetical protein
MSIHIIIMTNIIINIIDIIDIIIINNTIHIIIDIIMIYCLFINTIF